MTNEDTPVVEGTCKCDKCGPNCNCSHCECDDCNCDNCVHDKNEAAKVG